MALPTDTAALGKRIFQIIGVGSLDDYPGRVYDFINMLTIVAMTDAFFAPDYLLRLFTAKIIYAPMHRKTPVCKRRADRRLII